MRNIPEKLKLLPDGSNHEKLIEQQRVYDRRCSQFVVPLFFGMFLFLTMPIAFVTSSNTATLSLWALLWAEAVIATITVISTVAYSYFDKRHEIIKNQLWPRR